jgi:hypothetical protein
MRQRFLPWTDGDLQDLPVRVLAPQRGLASMGPVLNARGPNALVNGKSPGQPSKLNDVQRQAIADMIERGPITAVQGVVRWRLAATIHACSSRNLTGSAVNSKYRS